MANTHAEVDEVIKDLTERVGRDWKQLGRALGLSKTDLDQAEEQNRYVLRDRIHDIFELWKQRRGHDATAQSLKAALRDNNLGYVLVAKSDIEGSSSCDEDPPPTKKKRSANDDNYISEYKTSLVDTYSSELPRGSKWPAMGSNSYVDLVIYEKRKLEEVEVYRVTNVTGELEKFSELKQIEIMQVGVDDTGLFYPVSIITGAPGVGKSCFIWNLARKWQEKSLFKEFNLAIVVKLRDPYLRQAKRVVDLIQHENPEVCERVSNHIIKANGRGCLLLLDGFDELPGDLRRESIIKQIICGEKLSSASLIITTRSTTVKELYTISNRRKCQYLEILGFDQLQIDKYIVSAFTTNVLQKGFQQYLQCYPNIKSFMCIPLHGAIVVQIFKSQRCNKQAPKTMTELYTDAVKVLIIRSLQQEFPDLASEKFESFTDLPESIQDCLKKLAAIAFELTLNDELVFQHTFSKEMKKLDLLEEESDIYNPVSTSVTYNFVHKTIQEYLAAYHISTLPPDEQLTILHNNLCSRRMIIVLKFVAGFTKLNQHATVYNKIFDTDDIQGLVQLIHCLFETQHPDFIREALETKRTFDFTLQALSPHDCYALNYCIVMSKVEIDLRLDSSNISEEAFSMLLQPIAGMQSVFCYVKELIVTKTFALKSIISEICVSLMKNSCLTSLWIEECNIDAKGAEYIKKLLLQTKSLQRIVLNANPIRDQGARYIGTGLKENHSVKYLHIENCGITHIGLKAISEVLTQNKTLVELSISGNIVGNNGISLFCNELKSGSSLKKLLLHRCIVDPDDECIQSLRALSEKDDLTICIDYPIEQLLLVKPVNANLMMLL